MRSIVRGYCPMGCGQSLILEGARVRCEDFACSNPEAVQRILDNPETEHIVRISLGDVSVKHPLRERVEDDLFECPIFHTVTREAYAYDPGTYRVYADSLNELHFNRIPDREDPPHV